MTAPDNAALLELGYKFIPATDRPDLAPKKGWSGHETLIMYPGGGFAVDESGLPGNQFAIARYAWRRAVMRAT